MDALFFWLFSIIMLVSGVAVILNRNPVASLLCFVASIFAMSALFVMLSAFFLAIIEILVTAGAVMVLFLFVIMLINVTEAEKIPRRKVWMGFSLALGLGFILIVAKTLNATPGGNVNENDLPPAGTPGTPVAVDDSYGNEPMPLFAQRAKAVQALFIQGNTYFETGQYELAYTTYSKVLILDPYNKLAREKMAYIDASRAKIAAERQRLQVQQSLQPISQWHEDINGNPGNTDIVIPVSDQPGDASAAAPAPTAPASAPEDDTHQIGKLLFTTYVVPFEVTSLLILVATIGVIVLCKQDEPRRTSPRESIASEAPPLKEPALKS